MSSLNGPVVTTTGPLFVQQPMSFHSTFFWPAKTLWRVLRRARQCGRSRQRMPELLAKVDV
jgi:hypothetical protein